MAISNVDADLDVANGGRGEIIDIVLDERESHYSQMKLTYRGIRLASAYLLIKLSHSKGWIMVSSILPLVPMQRTFHVVSERVISPTTGLRTKVKQSVTRSCTTEERTDTFQCLRRATAGPWPR
jgi:hypothetical protein